MVFVYFWHGMGHPSSLNIFHNPILQLVTDLCHQVEWNGWYLKSHINPSSHANLCTRCSTRLPITHNCYRIYHHAQQNLRKPLLTWWQNLSELYTYRHLWEPQEIGQNQIWSRPFLPYNWFHSIHTWHLTEVSFHSRPLHVQSGKLGVYQHSGQDTEVHSLRSWVTLCGSQEKYNEKWNPIHQSVVLQVVCSTVPHSVHKVHILVQCTWTYQEHSGGWMCPYHRYSWLEVGQSQLCKKWDYV